MSTAVAELPTIYVTNAASVQVVKRGIATPEVAKAVGPGPALTIMAKPRGQYGECGVGAVPLLRPFLVDLEAVQAGDITEAEYFGRCEREFSRQREHLGPGKLIYRDDAGEGQLVPSGATLMCACSRSKASEGRCHRVTAAAELRRAGWVVILDGRALP